MSEPIKTKPLDIKQRGKRTQAEEQKLIEYELMIVRRKFAKINKELSHYQISDCEITYSEKALSPIDLHFEFWKKPFRWLLKTRNKNLTKK